MQICSGFIDSFVSTSALSVGIYNFNEHMNHWLASLALYVVLGETDASTLVGFCGSGPWKTVGPYYKGTGDYHLDARCLRAGQKPRFVIDALAKVRRQHPEQSACVKSACAVNCMDNCSPQLSWACCNWCAETSTEEPEDDKEETETDEFDDSTPFCTQEDIYFNTVNMTEAQYLANLQVAAAVAPETPSNLRYIMPRVLNTIMTAKDPKWCEPVVKTIAHYCNTTDPHYCSEQDPIFQMKFLSLRSRMFLWQAAAHFVKKPLPLCVKIGAKTQLFKKMFTFKEMIGPFCDELKTLVRRNAQAASMRVFSKYGIPINAMHVCCFMKELDYISQKFPCKKELIRELTPLTRTTSFSNDISFISVFAVIIINIILL